VEPVAASRPSGPGTGWLRRCEKKLTRHLTLLRKPGDHAPWEKAEDVRTSAGEQCPAGRGIFEDEASREMWRKGCRMLMRRDV